MMYCLQAAQGSVILSLSLHILFCCCSIVPTKRCKSMVWQRLLSLLLLLDGGAAIRHDVLSAGTSMQDVSSSQLGVDTGSHLRSDLSNLRADSSKVGPTVERSPVVSTSRPELFRSHTRVHERSTIQLVGECVLLSLGMVCFSFSLLKLLPSTQKAAQIRRLSSRALSEYVAL